MATIPEIASFVVLSFPELKRHLSSSDLQEEMFTVSQNLNFIPYLNLTLFFNKRRDLHPKTRLN